MKRRSTSSFLRLFVLLALIVAIVSVAGIAALSLETGAAEEKECYLPGDMNQDGEFTSKDAIYILYNSFFGDEEYPLAQDGDINGDGAVDNEDAIELLYESVSPMGSSYGEVVHDFYEPAWNWTETEDGADATVTLKCACGEAPAATVVVSQDEINSISAKCTVAGSAIFHAEATTACGKTYTSTYTKTLPGTGHTAGNELYADENRHFALCTECSAEVNVASHSWDTDGDPTAGTCQVAGTQAYKCADCGATKTENLGFAEHTYEFAGEVLTEISCTYAKKYECSVDGCEASKLADAYISHNYATQILTEATCSQEGQQVTKCQDCGDVRETKAIATNDHHAWDGGVEANGILTHTCDSCGKTKTTATAGDKGAVNQDTLQNADEVTVGDASMSMDDTAKENLKDNEQVFISVEKIDKEEIDVELDEEQKNQIVGDQVYDFNMTDADGNKIDFSQEGKMGTITISLPYELTEGEDVDAIEVWYIDEEGNLQPMEATYSNGYITFQTSHFSYYTVTRLTPKERCAKYGHIEIEAVVSPTCTEGGYSYMLCQRCGASTGERFNETEKLNHNYEVLESKDPDCDTFGFISSKCTRCNHEKTDVIAALGHDMDEEGEIVEDADCSKAGKRRHHCRRCDHHRDEDIPQRAHDYEHASDDKDQKADCTNAGYEMHTCKHCQKEVKKNEQPALGHQHDDTHAHWTWDRYTDAPVLVISCKHEGCSFTKNLEPNVEFEESSCEGDGAAKAIIFYNGIRFEKSIAGEKAKGHAWKDSWIVTEEGHYRKCSRENCNGQEKIQNHTFNNGAVTIAPTCTSTGLKLYTCTACKFTKEEMLPVADHSYQAVVTEPTCTEAGYTTFTCACGETYQEAGAAALGHNVVDSSHGTAPTCTEEGKAAYWYCGNCCIYFADPEMTEPMVDQSGTNLIIPARGHEIISFCPGMEPTCTEEGMTAYWYCGSCRVYFADEELTTMLEDQSGASLMIPALGHQIISSCPGMEPTCVEDGLLAYWYCGNCSIYFADKELTTMLPDQSGMNLILPATGVHNYDAGVVTMAPTCVDVGMRLLTCQDCGNTKEEILAANGEHNYVNDICSVCGKSKSDCSHKYVKKTQVDLSGYNVCEGTVIYIISCECGANQMMQIGSLGCEMEGFDFAGEDFRSYGEACINCGLGYNYTENYVLITDPCSIRTNILAEITVNTETVIEFTGFSMSTIEHPKYWTMAEEIDISHLGICTKTVRYVECPCGQTREYSNVLEACSVKYQDNQVYCISCGVVQSWEVNPQYDGCLTNQTTSYTLTNANGEQIWVYEDVFVWANHNYQVMNLHLLGENCQAGVIRDRVCTECAKEISDLYFDHETYLDAFYDLSEHGVCGGSYQRNSCACGEVAQIEIDCWDCNWDIIDHDENWERFQCTNCGLIKIESREEVQIADCIIRHIDTQTYPNLTLEGEGTIQCSTYWDEECHEFTRGFELLGESCDDGVRIIDTCTICGQVQEWIQYGHEVFEESFDLSQLGACGGNYVHHFCACGWEDWKDVWVDCFWIEIECGEDYTIFQCENCGATMTRVRTLTTQTPCETIYFVKDTYHNILIDGEELVMTYGEGYEKEHRKVATFELFGETCLDGFRMVETCLDCGRTWVAEGDGYHHTEVVAREMIEGVLCGIPEVLHYSCACGEETWTELRWVEYGCNFEGEYYDEVRDCTFSVCFGCGVTRYCYEELKLIDSSCCMWERINTFVFEANEEELFRYSESGWFERHDWTSSYEMMGQSCEDGVRYANTCGVCGATNEYEYWHHEMYQQVYKLNELGAVNGRVIVSSCLCGQQTEAWLEDECAWEWLGQEEIDGRYVDTNYCSLCGTYFRHSWGDFVGDGTCKKQINHVFEFYGEDGVVWASVEWAETVYEHSFYYELTLHDGATSCEDGFTVTERCRYCDFSNAWVSWGHETFVTSREVLVEEGIMCGKVEAYTQSCACGLYIYKNHDVYGCAFEYVEDEEMGHPCFKCLTCGTYKLGKYVTLPVEGESCQMLYVGTISYVRNGETLAVAEIQETRDDHWRVATFNMLGETCDDGYTITWVCQKCGEVLSDSERIYSGCTRRLVRMELVVSGENTCSRVYQYYQSCPCGQNTRETVSVQGDCIFYGYYDEALGRDIEKCINCGMYFITTDFDEPVDPENPCMRRSGWSRTYYLNDQVLGTAQYQTISYQHTRICHYTLLGETCADGYTVTWTCNACGEILEQDENVYTECQTRLVSVEAVLSDEAYCSQVYQYTYRCACGKEEELTHERWGDCQWEWQYVEELGKNVDVCVNCGLCLTTQREDAPIVGGPACQKQRTFTYSYYKDGELVATAVWRFVRINHTQVYTYHMLGQTCADGYTLSWNCLHCGEHLGTDETVYTDCQAHLTNVEVIVDDAAYCSKIYQYTYRCPCGKEQDLNRHITGNCEMLWQYDETLERDVQICVNCGLCFTEEFFREHPDENLPCLSFDGWIYNYYHNGQILGTVIDNWISYSHVEVYSFTLLGETCADGYTQSISCYRCGEFLGQDDNVYTECEQYPVAVELKLSTDVRCGNLYVYTYSCACGKLQNQGFGDDGGCSYEWYYDENLGFGYDVCVNCGIGQHTVSRYEAIEGEPDCHRKVIWTRTFYQNGEALFSIQETGTNINHKWVYTFELYGETCDEGYNAYGQCVCCGETSVNEGNYGCSTWYVQQIQAVPNTSTVCGAAWLYQRSCPCGENGHWGMSDACAFEHIGYEEESGREIYRCRDCGLTYTRNVEDDHPVGSCQGTTTVDMVFTQEQDGQTVSMGSACLTFTTASHTRVAHYTMLGETCADGYTISWSCYYCGKVLEQDESVYTDCQTRLVEIEIVLSDETCCTTLYQYTFRCACGKVEHLEYGQTGGCDWAWQYVEALGDYADVCVTCGMYYVHKGSNESIEGEPECHRYYTETTFYYKNGELLATTVYRNKEYSHTMLYRYNMFGESCTDGYTAEGYCMYCNEKIHHDENIYYDHNDRRVDRWNLADYGMCGGFVSIYSCGCGLNGHAEWSNGCNWEWKEERNEFGFQARYCATCNTTIFWGETHEALREQCRIERTFYFRAIRDDQILIDETFVCGYEEHTMLMTGKERIDENMATVYLQCAYCQKQETTTAEGHSHFTTVFIDLEAAGACGGYFTESQCILCDEKNVERTDSLCDMQTVSGGSKVVDGVRHDYDTVRCVACGLTLEHDWYQYVQKENCLRVYGETYVITMNGQQLGTVELLHQYEEHTKDNLYYELQEGATSCEDGVICKAICIYCGSEEVWYIAHHEQIKQADSIDLSQYGSVCGSYLEHYSCACGQYQHYQFSDEYCDLDQYDTEVWIENAVNDSQITVDGHWEGTWSYAHVYTCAVTDPQCAMQVRMSDYWLVENCIAVQYQTWQLGYSAEDGTWQREVTVATGAKRGYHNFEQTNEETFLDDGTRVNTNSYICLDCGTSITREHWYDAETGDLIKEVTAAINMINDGRAQKRTKMWEYGFVYMGHRLETLYRDEWIEANGDERWTMQEFTYDMEQCKRTYTNSYSWGGGDTHVNYHFMGNTECEWMREPTCSQSGVMVYRNVCVFCGEESNRWEEHYNPNTHCWCWNDEIGMYQCCTCGLKNINGADGTIVIEDMTAAYGEDTNYVVGYWNRGEGTFTVYASVILDDVTDEDNEIMLIGLNFTYLTVETDGICALSISQETVQAAATAALSEAGYAGSYAIRITFVPVDGDGSLDYAITFDSQMA